MGATIPGMDMPPYPCEEATETAVPRGTVPHFLPGKSPLPGVDPDATDRFGTPFERASAAPRRCIRSTIEKMKMMPRPAKVLTGGAEGGN